MSYCRWSDHSDVYVYNAGYHEDCWVVDIKNCPDNPQRFTDLTTLRLYLKKLEDEGVLVPSQIYDRIDYEMKLGVDLLTHRPVQVRPISKGLR